MATSEDVIKFQALSNKDRIICTTRGHTRHLAVSVQAMKLVDEISDIRLKLVGLSQMEQLTDEQYTHASVLLGVLREYRDSLTLDLEIAELQGGF